ncbi:hypothetical protein [Halorussus halophilus]|uniref:hypothetical protein n=1 Tax=Halorussus halophilus TaxID=2650975 RepID=UPI0013015510|nr:hypothetical protein [Halorussus halophilus]
MAHTPDPTRRERLARKGHIDWVPPRGRAEVGRVGAPLALSALVAIAEGVEIAAGRAELLPSFLGMAAAAYALYFVYTLFDL